MQEVDLPEQEPIPEQEAVEEQQPKRGGGPKTPAGKETSSRNAITHGLRTKKSLILEGESQEEYDAMAAAWREEFEPEGASGERLIQGVILNDWLLRRAESRYLETGHNEKRNGGRSPPLNACTLCSHAGMKN